ncbi:MAG: hypothetical protein RIC19_09490 [Phaeodactylibacter sp.]|uniref:DUF6503 family protein n=1 Tax=Phaeodactylibacter sp. TaxID=1940289 RepID=UPI0032EF1594
MNRLFLLLFLFTACNTAEEPVQEATLPGASDILRRSLQFHDPEEQWPLSHFQMIIDEPRTNFPERQSTILLNLPESTFEVTRNYEGTLVRRGMTADSCYNFIDGQPVHPADSATVLQYRLQCDRTQGYRSFYQLLTGLPMTLFSPEVSLGEDVEAVSFGPYACYAVPARLNNPIIGEQWVFYFDQSDFQLRGYRAAGEGAAEYLELDGLLPVNGMQLPRMRHWYNIADSTYMGSDIVITVEAL